MRYALGGYIVGVLLGPPLLQSAGGMSCYGIKGTFMVEAYGLEVGVYGFLVDAIWKILGELFVPVLVKFSKGGLTVRNVMGNMDNMLASMMKFVGVRLGLVALMTGRVLTFMVSILLLLMRRWGRGQGMVVVEVCR